MTKTEFIESVESQGLSPKWREGRVILPCACGEALCQGWAFIINEPDLIALHNRLYAPKIKNDTNDNNN